MTDRPDAMLALTAAMNAALGQLPVSHDTALCACPGGAGDHFAGHVLGRLVAMGWLLRYDAVAHEDNVAASRIARRLGELRDADWFKR